MNDLVSRISRYESLDLETYLNNTIQRYEEFLLEAEKYKASKVHHEIDTEILKIFLVNSNALLDILDAYEESYVVISNMIDLSKQLLRSRLSVCEEDVIVDKEQVNKFRAIIESFSEDAGVFATDERFLVHFNTFKEKCGQKCILVLTNDILLIGILQQGLRKYRLLNAYSYTIVRMDIKDGILRVRVDPTTYEFSSSIKSVEKTFKVFEELTYKYKKKHEDTGKTIVDQEMIEYLAFTEQYELLNPDEFAGGCPSKMMFYSKQEIVKYLSVLTESKHDASVCLYSFLESRFKDGMRKINQIQTLDGLIADVFAYFKEFFDEQDELIRDLETISSIRRSGVTLLIEKQLIECFKAFEHRIFNKSLNSNQADHYIKLVVQNLKFSGCNFCYLMDSFVQKNEDYKLRCIENAMKEIEKIIRSIIME
ncbi:hypothetical protein OCOL_000044 [Ordospora colligata]|uniref:Uncharacterized protein n=1 Tax=Ordospora colligata OC4 TaxID=1354746 RepID=A0A0B2ULE1_9MICR|nr:uncharacterized protein M896_051790 [Ordospora colligata OC4]KHN69770.1 hypothetical protein M896_051790 [Ordospora colligata OC4]TBU15573.1 hypothetical protein CWI41_051780 [Ordospora colligata]TBU15640.1 hypothetical protein CWI40_051760 [Ordospora colligata]